MQKSTLLVRVLTPDKAKNTAFAVFPRGPGEKICKEQGDGRANANESGNEGRRQFAFQTNSGAKISVKSVKGATSGECA